MYSLYVNLQLSCFVSVT